MDVVLEQLAKLKDEWKQLAIDMECRGEAYSDNYAYGVLYGLQICLVDLEQIMNEVSCSPCESR